MASDLEANLRWTRRANIERYRKILRTSLTAEERTFVERRLAEEEAALQRRSLDAVANAGKSAHEA
jgi:hypothetical protein